ncbi:MAG: hypothetical protein H6672_16570 [Anaerolineaceae bacterium]|nr:hypothetical protein [Anaerolineaceae bacterium]
MTLSDAWDRLFWSIMIVIFIGLVWIGLLEQVIGPCDGPGLVVAVAVGIAFFYQGWHQARTHQDPETQTTDEDL